MRHPRLRDSHRLLTEELYPLNEIPDDLIVRIGGYLVYLLYTGRKDLSGSDWGNAFADAIGGCHLDKPVGIADVVKDRMAWSLKTVKKNNPFTTKTIRLISGRCSPDFSYGISDPHEDVQQTGRAVLGIWNERVNIAYDNYNPVRSAILVRSGDLTEYCIFEEENHRFRTSDYVWEEKANGNIVGRNIESGEIKFTWQPHGAQFTIHTHIPHNAVKFTVQKPLALNKDSVLKALEFDPSWVKIIR